MKSTGEWKFKICPDTYIYDGYWKAFEPRKHKKKFALFGWMKIYTNEKNYWTNKSYFMKRYNE
jgi:hypothetical protein